MSVERLGATHLFRVLRGALHLVDSGTEASLTRILFDGRRLWIGGSHGVILVRR